MWTKAQDCGGLRHVSNDTFDCFKAIEVITYQLIERGYEDSVTSEAYDFILILNQWFLPQKNSGFEGLTISHAWLYKN